jgi:hypothetical protein
MPIDPGIAWIYQPHPSLLLDSMADNPVSPSRSDAVMHPDVWRPSHPQGFQPFRPRRMQCLNHTVVSHGRIPHCTVCEHSLHGG